MDGIDKTALDELVVFVVNECKQGVRVHADTAILHWPRDSMHTPVVS